MARYVMQETNLQQEDGKKRLFPRLIGVRPMEHDKLVQYISDTTGLSKSVIGGVLDILAERMATWMGEGYSIKIDNFGRFTPTLGLKEGVEREESEEDGELGANGKLKSKHRNATSIEVNNVSFVPDKKFLRAINKWIDLERSPYQKTIRPNQCPYSEEERKRMLVEYLQENTFINCATYMTLTKQKRTAATNELRRWSDDPESSIQAQGRAPHRLYVLKKSQT